MAKRDLNDQLPRRAQSSRGERVTIDIVEAHRLITTTMTPIVDIAEAAGCSVLALEKRLERAYGKRSRELRTGAFPTPGRTPSAEPRKRWEVRLTPAERAMVEAAVEAAGAETDGAALARICAGWLGRNGGKNLATGT